MVTNHHAWTLRGCMVCGSVHACQVWIFDSCLCELLRSCRYTMLMILVPSNSWGFSGRRIHLQQCVCVSCSRFGLRLQLMKQFLATSIRVTSRKGWGADNQCWEPERTLCSELPLWLLKLKWQAPIKREVERDRSIMRVTSGKHKSEDDGV